MKSSLLSVLFITSVSLFGQDEDKKSILKSVGTEACECMDSIQITVQKNNKDILDEVQECIHQRVLVYQIGSQMEKLLPEQNSFENPDELVDSLNQMNPVEIVVSDDKDSPFYKDTYNAIERELMENCAVLQSIMANDNTLFSNSISENQEALRYYSLGNTEFDDGNYESALAYYKEAVRIDPKFAFAWDNLGLTYRRLNQNEKAIEAYLESLKLDPEGPVPLQNIALTYRITGQYKKAIEAYEHLGKIYPEDPEVFYGLGQIYFEELDELEKGLENACQAYNLYIKKGSPYRSDAELMISIIFHRMKEKNKEDEFFEILKKHNISIND